MLKIGYIGLGCRGKGMLKTVLDSFKDVEIVGVCDVYEDRIQEGLDIIKDKRGTTAFGTTNSDEIMKMVENEILTRISPQRQLVSNERRDCIISTQ